MNLNRRDFILAALAASSASLAGCRLFGGVRRRIAINPSTIREFHLPFLEQVRLAVAAGYDGIEPWLKDLHAARADGTLDEAVRLARDNGLAFVNGIAFGTWSSPNESVRAAGIAETRRDMALLAEIGCPRIAASMLGIQKSGSPVLSAAEIAERYAYVLDLGREYGVRPLLEYWGHSVNLCSPEAALAVLRLLNAADGAVLPDVYHTWRGGGSFATFAKFTAAELPVLHVNDYPTDRPRTALVDADRVWPGAGGAPWGEIFAALDAAHADPWLSLELFNLSYQKTTPLWTLKTGLAHTQSACERASK